MYTCTQAHVHTRKHTTTLRQSTKSPIIKLPRAAVPEAPGLQSPPPVTQILLVLTNKSNLFLYLIKLTTYPQYAREGTNLDREEVAA